METLMLENIVFKITRKKTKFYHINIFSNADIISVDVPKDVDKILVATFLNSKLHWINMQKLLLQKKMINENLEKPIVLSNIINFSCSQNIKS